MKRIAPLVILVALIGTLAVLFWPTGTTTAPIYTPTVAPSLPPCENEDGSGQMLCFWNASESGNGIGTDVVAGDCSVGTVGTIEASDWCTTLYVQDGEHIENVDGSSTDIPNGKALVEECETIAFDASQDVEMQKELENDGWTLTECFKGMAE